MPEQLSFFRFKALPVTSADLPAGCGQAPARCGHCDYPVTRTDPPAGCDGMAWRLPPPPREYAIAMFRGHGSFAVARVRQGVFRWTSSLEASCKALFPLRPPSPRESQGGEGRR